MWCIHESGPFLILMGFLLGIVLNPPVGGKFGLASLPTKVDQICAQISSGSSEKTFRGKALRDPVAELVLPESAFSAVKEARWIPEQRSNCVLIF